VSFGVPAALLLYLAGGFDLNGSATVEVRGGRAPIVVGQPSEWGFMGVVTPDVQLSYLSHRLDLRLDYGLRAFWRLPNDSRRMTDSMMVTTTSSRLDPLLLHQVGLFATGQVSRRLRMNGEAAVSYGEADYTILSTILGGPGQAALPTIPKFLSISAVGGSQIDLSRLSVFSLALSFTHRRPIGSMDGQNGDVNMPNVVPFPRQTFVAATPGLSLKLNRQGALTLAAPISYGIYSDASIRQDDGTMTTGNQTVLLFAPQVGWRAFVSTRTNLHFGAGANFVRLRPENMQSKKISPVYPVGDVTFESVIPKQQGLETRVLGAVRMDYYYDAFSGRAGPRLQVSASGYSAMTTDWLAGVEAGYSTVFAADLETVAGQAAPPVIDDTAVYVSIPIRHRASSHLLTEFGFRWADRSPNALTGFHQQQLWLYFLLTGTTRASTLRRVQ